MGKQSVYEAALKPPLFMAGPGIRRGETDALRLPARHFPHGLRPGRHQNARRP